MDPTRKLGSPAISCLPRSSLHISVHKDVDVILKELKGSSRRLQAVLDSYTDELLILERLYYRNKNQHRAALFFRRVSEMRRYGQRLVQWNLSKHVELLRASFFGFTTLQE